MTQSIFAFSEPLPLGSGLSVLTTDRGVVGGVAVDPSAAAVTPAAVGAVLLASEANVRYADLAGSAAGTGSRAQPMATIQQAIDKIKAIGTQSATNPWVVKVGVGLFPDPFLYEPWIFVHGVDRQGTVVSNPSAQQLSAAFSGAGSLDTGIANATIGAALTANFATVASPGAGRFFLTNALLTGQPLVFTGNNNQNLVSIFGCEKVAQAPVATHLLTNLVYFLSHSNFRADSVTSDTTTATYTTNPFITQFYTAGTLTLAAAVGTIANAQRVHLAQDFEAANRIVVTGDAVGFSGATFYQVAAPDADTTFQLDQFSVGATKLISGGNNLISANPTAPRTYTFGLASSIGFGTRIRLKNRAAFPITLAFVDPATSDASFIGVFGFGEFFFANGAWNLLNPEPQFGAGVLTNGVSAALIPADITAQSVIVATLKTFSGAAGGLIQAKDTDRVVGTRAGGGGFKLTSVAPATGATVATDNGTYDWMVMRP